MWNGAEFAWQSIARQPWDCARECIRDPWPSPASLPLQAHGAPGCTQNHLGPSPFSPGKWIVWLIIFLRVNYWIPSFCEMESLLLTFINVFGTLFLLSFRITYRGLLVDISTWKRWQKPVHGLWYRSTTYHFLPAVSQAEPMLVFLVVNSLLLVNQLLGLVICHLVEGFWQDYSRQSTCAGRKVGVSEEKMRGQTWIQRDSCHIRLSSPVVYLR